MSGFYSAEIVNWSRGGWSLRATQGADPDLDDQSVRTWLASPFTVSWGFEDETIPNSLSPTRARFSVWARTAADLPVLDTGDVFQVKVNLGPDLTGPSLIDFYARAAEPVVDLVPGDPWAARLTVTAADFLIDLPGRTLSEQPAYGTPSPDPIDLDDYVGHRWAVLGSVLQTSIGVQGGIVDYPNPLRRSWGGGDLRTLADELLNSTRLIGPADACVLIPSFAFTSSYPPGTQFVDPTGNPPGDPGSWTKYTIASLGRHVETAAKLALQFVKLGGIVGLRSMPSSPATGTFRPVSLDARYCRIPVTVTRRRNHLINRVRVKGAMLVQVSSSPEVPPPTSGTWGETSFVDKPDVYEVAGPDDGRGPIAREVETQWLVRYMRLPSLVPVVGEVAELARVYLADDVARATTWVYDELEVYASDMPADMAAQVLPYLTPSVPWDGRDQRILRQVQLHRVDSDVARVSGLASSAWIAAGTLTVADGQLRYVLRTVPGGHTYATPPTPITLGEFAAYTWAPTSPITVLDDRITVADLANVDT